VADAIGAMRVLLGENDAMAYLVNMAPRLVELHRVLKPTGSLYLHCDPTMSHYLKVLLDAIFGADLFRGEIIWKRTTAHSDAKQGRKLYGRIHDVLLFYTRSAAWTWNTVHVGYDESYIRSHYRFVEEGTGRQFRKADLTAAKPGGDTSYEWRGVHPYKGRYWAYSQENMQRFQDEGRLVYTRTGMPELKRYLDEMPGLSLQDIWTDIDPINPKAAERLGYPTQKPLALLQRIIEASSNPGDVVLDPFCGCGTTIDAAQRTDRSWVGIDIAYIAVDLIEKRLHHTYGDSVHSTYEVKGIPRDLGSARRLFQQSPFEFERWAVSLVNGTPNQRQVGDKGVDGVIRFLADRDGAVGRVLVSVKGGKTVAPTYIRDLVGTVHTQRAEMGSMVTLTEPSRGVRDALAHAGNYVWPVNRHPFPRAQLITVADLLAGRRLETPPTLLPYISATRRSKEEAEQLLLDF
jgi:DNA modification methylase